MKARAFSMISCSASKRSENEFGELHPGLRIAFPILVLLVSFVLAGCDGETTGANTSNGAGPDGTEPASDEPFVRLKVVVRGGPDIQFSKERGIERPGNHPVYVSPPTDWLLRTDRREGYVLWFTEKRSTNIPAIFVAVEDGVDKFVEVTRSNAIEFGKLVLEELNSRDETKYFLEQEVVPLVCGSRACVRYVKKGRLKGSAAAIEKQILETQVGGRRYRVELWVYEDEMEMYKYAGYSLMAGLEFHDE